MKTIQCILFLAVSTISGRTLASDTLRVTIHQADSIFLSRNYALLIAGLNIEAQRAAEIQAKLYPNPVFTADLNAYDPENKRAFHLGPTGQQGYQLEQLILLGGKRKSLIGISKTQTAIAELEFQDLLKQLKYELRSNLYYLDQQGALIARYDNQIKTLGSIIELYENQSKKGNIPLKDVVRLKSASLDLRSEKALLIREYTEALLKVQVLLQTDLIVQPVIQSQEFGRKVKVFAPEELVREALENRADYGIAQQYQELANQQLSLEKRMVVPDVNLFTSYDQRGGAFANQVNVGFSIPLPLWNRNQGNIRMSELKVQQQAYELNQAQTRVQAEVKGYLAIYNRAVRDFEVADQLYNSDFETTLQGMSRNFQLGNISLIEFVDFFESFNESLGDFSRIRVQLGVAAEQLNFIVGKEVF